MTRQPDDLNRRGLSTIPALRVVLLLILALSAWAIFYLGFRDNEAGLLFSSHKLQLVLVCGVAGCLVDIAALLATINRKLLSEGLDRLSDSMRSFGWFNVSIFTVLILGFASLVMGPTSKYYTFPFMRVLAYFQVVLIGTFLLKISSFRINWLASLAAAAVLTAFALNAASFISDISPDPFAFTWSEGSQYYNASLFFARQVYGVQLPWPVLNPSKYLIQSLPFLLPNSSIWMHRLWESILWISMPLITGWLLARRLGLADRFYRWIFVIWATLYLMSGAVYYHLLVCVILILWGFTPAVSSRKRSILSLAVVTIASIWAGISRVNWFPVPGILASCLYFLETRKEGKSTLRYSLKGLTWTIYGGLIALITCGVYIFNSGNPPLEFTSSFTADLLWYRLFPNPTYLPGILPAILVVSLPLILIIVWDVRFKKIPVAAIRWLVLAGLTTILFIGGLTASVKIGAGSNLHNLDAYMLLIFIIPAYIYHGRMTREHTHVTGVETSERMGLLPRLTLTFTFILPVVFSLAIPVPNQRLDSKVAANNLEVIQKFSSKAVRSGGEVVFITERQLLTFHQISGVPLVAEYEKFFLMEMAMAGNRDYMEHFYDDLRNHRFALIITEPVLITARQANGKFGEEDQVWREKVNAYLYCYYLPVRYLREVDIYILAPRPSPRNQCP
jgi:hypothetical protein